MYCAGFKEFTTISECLRLNSILSYLDGPLEDLLMEDMDVVLARIHQCMITYCLKIGQALCDVAPFGTLLESILAHANIFPICVSDPLLCGVEYLNYFSWWGRMIISNFFSISPTSVSSLPLH